MDFQSTVVLNETHIPESVHEETDPRPGCAHHLCEGLLADLGNSLGLARRPRSESTKANSSRPDLIVMDLSMPVMNGFEAVRLHKDLMPDVPVIIYTDHGAQIVETQARAAGAAAATVFKPENVAVLIRTIRSLLDTTAA